MSREATFRGRLDFCSNFYWPFPVRLDGEAYDSVEHAYQAAKFLAPGLRILFRSADGIGTTPGEAKKLARKLTAQEHLRKDWEQASLGIMEDLVRQKFSLYPTLREKLLATGEEELVEGNYWHDNFWGACSCRKCEGREKHNHLGRILMKVRGEARHGQGAQAAGVLP